MSRADSTVKEPPAPDAGAGRASSLLRKFRAMSWTAAAHLLGRQGKCMRWLAAPSNPQPRAGPER